MDPKLKALPELFAMAVLEPDASPGRRRVYCYPLDRNNERHEHAPESLRSDVPPEGMTRDALAVLLARAGWPERSVQVMVKRIALDGHPEYLSSHIFEAWLTDDEERRLRAILGPREDEDKDEDDRSGDWNASRCIAAGFDRIFSEEGIRLIACVSDELLPSLVGGYAGLVEEAATARHSARIRAYQDARQRGLNQDEIKFLLGEAPPSDGQQTPMLVSKNKHFQN